MSVRPSVRPSVRLSAWNNSAPSGRIFLKFGIWIFFETLSKKKSKFYYSVTRITSSSHEEQYTFFIISRSLLLGMRNVSEQYCRKNKNTHFIFSNIFFENRAVYELMWKNIVQPDMQQMTVWRMRIACWIPKVTNTHSEYVILIAFLLQ